MVKKPQVLRPTLAAPERWVTNSLMQVKSGRATGRCAAGPPGRGRDSMDWAMRTGVVSDRAG